VYKLEVDTVMLTVLGFVIGLAISFRTSTAYERYSDGRRFWTEIIQSSRDLCRHIWIHVEERHSNDPAVGRADLLGKVTALNLILTFAVALKHKLRFEPYVNHEDLEHLVAHLTTYAGEAVDPTAANPVKDKTRWRKIGEYLDVSFAAANPRKAIKTSTRNLGHLPMEVLLHLNAYLDGANRDKTMDGTIFAMALANLQTLNSAMAGTERVLNTPLPVAYSIAISQITWIYILALPFQLYATLGWITIPGCILSAYVILGLASIGSELENPFGRDTNDLPLDDFCKTLAREIDVICSRPQFKMNDFVSHEKNTPLFNRPYAMWHGKSTDEIRNKLRLKTTSATIVNDPIESAKQFGSALQVVPEKSMDSSVV
jgi:ion channel-forming bestrophin family protein